MNLENCLKLVFQTLDAELSEEHRASIKTMDPDNLAMLHTSIGQYIRNRYRLWGPSQIVDAFRNETDLTEPDDMSAAIIRAYWDYLNMGPRIE